MTPRIRPGDPVYLHPASGFGQLTCTAIEVLPNGSVRVRWDGLADPGMIIPEHWVELIRPTSSPTDGTTSAGAAASITPSKQRDDHQLVLTLLASVGADGLTDFELAARAGRKQTSLGVRRGELCKAGSVRNTGRKRPSDVGSPSSVWEITELGLEALTAMSRAGAA